MDNSQTNKSEKVLRRRNSNGSVTFRRKPAAPARKIVIARGRGTKTMGAVITSKLTPFAPAMRKELARRGFSTGGLDFKNLMALYYNEIVSDKNISSNGLKPINAYEFTNNFVFRVTPSDNLNGDLTDIHNQLAFENVNTVTSDIINSFRIAMAKKRAAVSQGLNPSHVLTDTELLQARAGERVQNSLEQEVTDNKPVTFGQLRGLIIWILVIVLIFQFVK